MAYLPCSCHRYPGACAPRWPSIPGAE